MFQATSGPQEVWGLLEFGPRGSTLSHRWLLLTFLWRPLHSNSLNLLVILKYRKFDFHQAINHIQSKDSLSAEDPFLFSVRYWKVEKEIDAFRLRKLTASLGEHKTTLSSSSSPWIDMFGFFLLFASSFSTTWKCKLFWLGILWFLTSWLIRLLQPFMWECTKQTVRKRSYSTLFFFSKAYFSTLDWPSKWATKHHLWWFYPKNRNSGYENLKKRCLLVLLARTCAWKISHRGVFLTHDRTAV